MSLSILLVAINSLLVIGVIAIKWRSRSVVLLDPAWAFIAGYSINYCVKPFLFLVSPEAAMAYSYTDTSTVQEHMIRPILMSMVLLFCFSVGNLLLGRGLTLTVTKDKLKRALTTRSFKLLNALLLFGGLISLYLFISEIGWSGTVGEILLGQARTDLMANNQGKGYYFIAVHLSLLAWCMYCANIGLTEPHPRKLSSKVFTTLLFAVAMLVQLVVGARLGMVMVVVGASLLARRTVLLERKRRLSLRIIGVGLGLLALICGPMGLLMKDMEFSTSNVLAMTTSAWDSFELHTQMPPDADQRRLYGQSYLEDVLYTFMPRLWFDKPERFGIVRVQDIVAPSLAAASTGTFPPGILLEAYCNFGWFGIAFVPALIGFACVAFTLKLHQRNTFWIVQGIFISLGVLSFRAFGNIVASFIFDAGVITALIWLSQLLSKTAGLLRIRSEDILIRRCQHQS